MSKQLTNDEIMLFNKEQKEKDAKKAKKPSIKKGE